MEFSEDIIQQVWDKGTIVSGDDSKVFRKDYCKAWILRNEYGNRKSKFGWEIDHIKPVSSGGGDELSNLRPLHWENNASKQSGRLTCVVTASGKINIRIK